MIVIFLRGGMKVGTQLHIFLSEICKKFLSTIPTRHLNSFLRWQEASSFVIQTENDNTPNIHNNERILVTSIGALNVNYIGVEYLGLNNNIDATRVSISERGSAPLTRPKSLLHLGYDYGNTLNLQGYPRWMDLGVLTSTNRDHVSNRWTKIH